MALKPEISLMAALATGAVVWSIYDNAVPSVPDVRVSAPNDPNVSSARKMATWTAAGTVAGISLIAKDPTIFIVGGGMIIVADWWIRHANNNNPMATGITPGGARVALQDMPSDPAYMSGMSG